MIAAIECFIVTIVVLKKIGRYDKGQANKYMHYYVVETAEMC